MRRWSLDGIEPDSPLVLAAALDPRFKSLKFLTDDLKQSVREELSQLKDKDCGNPNFQATVVKEKDSSTTPPAKKKKTALDILLGDDDDSERCDNDTEVDEFVLEKSLPHNSDIMA